MQIKPVEIFKHNSDTTWNSNKLQDWDRGYEWVCMRYKYKSLCIMKNLDWWWCKSMIKKNAIFLPCVSSGHSGHNVFHHLHLLLKLLLIQLDWWINGNHNVPINVWKISVSIKLKNQCPHHQLKSHNVHITSWKVTMSTSPAEKSQCPHHQLKSHNVHITSWKATMSTSPAEKSNVHITSWKVTMSTSTKITLSLH